MNKIHYQFKLRNLYPISNSACLCSFYANDEEQTVRHSDIRSVPALDLLSISITDPQLFSPLGDESADEEDQVIAMALQCGDFSLLPEPSESRDWEFRQQLPAILAGKVPEWRLMATNFDSAGASLVIAHRDPLPDGYVNLREYLLPTTHACTFTVRTVNGQTHTYLQRPGSHLLQNCLIQSDAAGNYDLRFFSESQLRGSSTIVDVIQCRV